MNCWMLIMDLQENEKLLEDTVLKEPSYFHSLHSGTPSNPLGKESRKIPCASFRGRQKKSQFKNSPDYMDLCWQSNVFAFEYAI